MRSDRRRRVGGLSALLVALALTSFAPADLPAQTIYVPNASDGTVSAVDANQGQELWRLPVSEPTENRPAGAAHGIAVSPDGKTLFAGDTVRGELVVIDIPSRSIATRIAISHAVHGIDISPDGKTVWVGGASDDRFWLGELTVVDTATLSAAAVVAPGVGSAAHVSFSPDGRWVWVASTTTNGVWVVDATSYELIDTIPLVPIRSGRTTTTPEGDAGIIGINEVAVSPDGRRAFAIGPESSVLFSIDTETRRVIGTAQGAPRAHGVVVSPGGDEVWVANRSGSVSIFDTATLQPVATIPVGEYANHVAFNDAGTKAFVTGRDSLTVIDASSFSVTRTISVGRDPHEIAISSAPPRVVLVGGRQERPGSAQDGAGTTTTPTPSADLIPIDDPFQALALANSWKIRFPNVATYVTTENIRFLLPDEQIVDVPMPPDSMVVAAAPYIRNTHPCTVHTMSSCQAELRNEPIEVTVLDEEGRIFLNETVKSLGNGFVELWLPRDRRFRIRFEARGLAVESTVETFDGSPTCITNLPLSGVAGFTSGPPA